MEATQGKAGDNSLRWLSLWLNYHLQLKKKERRVRWAGYVGGYQEKKDKQE